MSKTWLWLEDDTYSTFDIEAEIKSIIKDNLKKFDYIPALQEFLINNKKNLQDYGFIVDIMIAGEFYIKVSKEWCGKEQIIDTHRGDKAGLVFVKDFVLCKNENESGYIWKPPPPIIFVSVLRQEVDITDDLKEIKIRWKEAYKEAKSKEPEELKVAFFNKWEDPKVLKKYVKRFSK